MKTNLKAVHVASFLAHLLSVIDKGKYNHITMKEMSNAIESGQLFQFLKSQLGDDFDISLWSPDDRKALTNSLYDRILVYRPKYGIREQGICLLAYLATEVVLMHMDEDKLVEISLDDYVV